MTGTTENQYINQSCINETNESELVYEEGCSTMSKSSVGPNVPRTAKATQG